MEWLEGHMINANFIYKVIDRVLSIFNNLHHLICTIAL